MADRRYCYRVGGPIDAGTDDKCPECGDYGHAIISNGECGIWYQCSDCTGDYSRVHGHACPRPADHGGKHGTASGTG